MLEIPMTLPLITVKDVRKSFPIRRGPFRVPAELHAVNGVSFTLGEQETLGIAGESGSGKSTLAKLLLRLLPASGGEIRFRDSNLAHLTGRELHSFRKNVQMIFQDPYASLNPRMRVGDIIGEPLKIHGQAGSSSYHDQVLTIMARVGLNEEQYYRYPHEFSGGQRQRIGIARALAVDPQLIIADEPVSALDLSIQAQIINLLQELKHERALSFIVIAHDLSVLRHMSDRIAVMYLGAIVEIGHTETLFSACRHPYTEALLSAVPQLDTPRRGKRIVLRGDAPSPTAPPTGCPFHPRCPYAQLELCAVTPPPLTEKAAGHLVACHFSDQCRMIY
jgi:peptide/nickel transport system ATP-binding protein